MALPFCHPTPTLTNVQFVSVGPSGFTVAGIVHLGNTVMPKVLPSGFQGNTEAAFIIKLLSDLAGLWMWGLCLWFFFVSVGAHWQLTRPHHPQHHIQFDITWYVPPPSLVPAEFLFQSDSSLLPTNTNMDKRFSFVFPNSALVTATMALGNSLNSNGLKLLGTVLSCLLVLVWIFVFSMMIRGLYLRRLLWPGTIDGAEASRRRWMSRVESLKTKEIRGRRNTAG